MAKTKKLDRVYVERVAALLRPILEEKFRGNETAMAKDMKVSQPQLNSVLKKHGGERGVGIVFLLAVRAYLRDTTLDDILGLDPPEFVRLTAVEATIDRALDKRLGAPDPHRESGDEPARLLPAAALPTSIARRKRS